MVKSTVLDNRLTIATDTIDNFETVSIGLFVNVGSVNEDESLCGVSHFVEHMAFKGTEKRTALQISEAIESVGGYMNAYTGKEITAYYVKVLKDDIELAVDVISDIVQNSTFQEDEFEKERGVIVQEINRSNDSPDDLVFEIFQSQSFKDEELGMPILGTVDNINAFKPADLHDYLHNNYSASKMIMAAAGNVDHNKLVDLASKYTPKIKDFVTKKVETQQYQGGVIYKEKDLEQIHMILGFEGISHDSPDKYDMMVLSTLMGGGMSSRLFQEVREKRGLAYSIFSYLANYKDTGVFGIYAGCDINRAPETLEVINNEMKIVDGSVTAAELSRAKTQIKAAILMGLESSSTRMERMASQHLLYKRFLTIQEISQAIDNVNIDTINAAIKKLNSSKRTLAVVGNSHGIEKLSQKFETL